MNKITIEFTDVEENMNWSLDKPLKEKVVSYIITIERENGHSDIAGSARVGEEIDLSELCDK